VAEEHPAGRHLVRAFKLFLSIEGVGHAALNSVIAAGICMALSIALGAPAGYALARYTFPGQNLYRLLILLDPGLSAGHPGAAADRHLHPRRPL
jgi:ABC-type glycerol-3-phosphate transport system permease component